MTPRRRASSTRRAKDDVTIAIDAFRRILRELRIAARRTELATGLSAAQTFVLNAVIVAPGCSLNDVATLTLTDRSSVGAIVDRLVEERYLTRVQSEQDRRRAALTITERGRRAIHRAAPPPTTLLVDGIRALAPEDRSALASSLVRLTRKMKIADEPAGMLFEDGTARRRR